jgi:hypothetical protein
MRATVARQNEFDVQKVEQRAYLRQSQASWTVLYVLKISLVTRNELFSMQICLFVRDLITLDNVMLQ